MIDGFDENQLNTDSGLSDSPIKLEDNGEGQFAMNNEDKSALQKIAEVPPTGVTVPPPVAAPAVPDYLTTFIPAPPETPVVREEKNWSQIWKETFGEEPSTEAAVNQNSFEAAVVRRDAYDGFLNQTEGVAGLRAITTGQLPEKDIVQQAVKSELQRNGIRSSAVYDQEMSAYIDGDGNLTDAGVERAAQEKERANTQLSKVEDAATKHANKAVEDLNTFYSVLDTTATTFKPYGLALPETMVSDMKEDIRSGRVDNWLDSSTTAQEATDKLYLLALVSDPARFAEFVRLADKRGQEYGGNRRLASQLS